MQQFIRRSLYVAMLLVMPLLLPRGSFAWNYDFSDLNLLLNGEYRISFIESCVQTAGEFDEDFRVPSGLFRTRSKGGITTYNGDGTGTFSALVLNMFESNPFGSFVAVSQSSTECDLTYTVNPDRSFTQTLTNCSGTVLTGPRTGEPFTLSDVELQGQITRWRQVLNYTNNDTTVVTLILNPGTPEELIRKRICAGIGTGVMRSVYEHEYDHDREYDYRRDRDYDYDDDDEDRHKHRHRHKHKNKHRHKHRGDD